ncbi:hypothetical protein KRM28CT15_66200 [Krasilnikovia sp. M28-CT-15]
MPNSVIASVHRKGTAATRSETGTARTVDHVVAGSGAVSVNSPSGVGAAPVVTPMDISVTPADPLSRERPILRKWSTARRSGTTAEPVAGEQAARRILVLCTSRFPRTHA